MIRIDFEIAVERRESVVASRELELLPFRFAITFACEVPDSHLATRDSRFLESADA